MARRAQTKAQLDRFIIEWMSHADPGRAYRDAGLAPATRVRKTNGNGKRSHKPDHDRVNGNRLLKDPYVAGIIAQFRQQQIDKFTDEADATRYEIMSGYRRVYEMATSSGESRELNAAVRSLDGMARMMGYLIEHKIIHHERSDKQIEKMNSTAELQMVIKALSIELGPSTMRMLTGGVNGGSGEVIDITPEQPATEEV